MLGPGHVRCGQAAFDALPAWQQEMIRPDLSASALDRPYLGPTIRTARDKMAALCQMLDLVYYEECRPYATLADGRWIPHCPPDERWQSSEGSGRPMSRKVLVAVLDMLLRPTVEAVQRGDWEQFVRWGGALAHFLQDCATPGHAIPNRLFAEFWPDPDPTRHIRLHFAFDTMPDVVPVPTAVLMGETLAEAAFRLQVAVDRTIRDGKKLVGPIIESVYRGQAEAVRQAMLLPVAARAAFLTASAWYTALCLGTGRFDPDARGALGDLDLTDLVPLFWHAGTGYDTITPGHLVVDTRLEPIYAWVRTGDGRRVEQRFEKGFGMGSHMAVKFFVDGRVFPRFHCQVGLASRATQDQDEHVDATWFVAVDPDENTVYSEDIEYGARRVQEVRLVPGQPVTDVDVDLGGAQTLILGSQCRPFTDPASGQLTFRIPQVAVVNPVLGRRKEGPS